MQIFTSKNNCCGCSACQNICPKNAITMMPDEEGFLYPQIDDSKCIECGACKNVCAFQNGYIKNHSENAYAIKHKDLNTRMTSRSGGVFIAITDYILSKGGVIYGAAFDSDFSVHHIRATTAAERDLMKGSKYVQSRMDDIFAQVKKDLKDGLYVVFSGTGCQVGGLTKYLEKCDTSKLYTCDLVCHGVPSPQIWKDYVDLNKKRYGDKIEKVEFRDKSIGWRNHKESFVINGVKHMSNEYAYLFMGNHVERPSCFNCKYTNIDRPADFTLADFWRINDIIPGFNDEKGVSLLLVNSQKAAELFKKIKDDTICYSCDLQKSIAPNPNLFVSSKRPDDRDVFWQEYQNKGFDYVLKKYYGKEKRKRMRKMAIAKLKKPFKK